MSQLQQSFGRIVNLKVFATIIESESSGALISYSGGYTVFPSQYPDGRPGFRIRGKINKIEAAVSVIPNPIQIAIYNLGANSRALVESKVGTKIIVEAGYSNNPKQIFFGNILWARTHKEGPDYVTEIQAGDGSFAVSNGQINQSFSGPTTYSQAIDACIASLGQSGITKGTVTGVPSGGYNNGIVLVGSPLDRLKEICNKLELSCSVQNGQVTIVPLGQDKGSPTLLVSQDNGMIGIPQIRTQGLIAPATSVNQTTPTNIISFQTLMRPEMEMYQKVTVRSKFINGDYIVARVTHEFDSWEGPFFTECECASA